MTHIEQLRALLGKLPNPTEALELLDKVAAVPVVGEPVAWTVQSPCDFSSDFSAYKTKTYVTPLVVQPADSIPRARLDELLAAEKQLNNLKALSKDDTRAIYSEWQHHEETQHGLYLRFIDAALAASKGGA